MNNEALIQLENAFYELFPDAKSFYLGLKAVATGAGEVDVGNASSESKQPIDSFLKMPEKPKYVSRVSIRSRIFTTVSDNNCVMTSGEIVEKLRETDPNIMDHLSSQLTVLKKEGMLVNYSPTGSKRDTYWGLRNWRDKDGNFRSEHLPESVN